VSSKTLAQERFSRYADGYVTSQTHAQGAELDLLVDIAEPRTDWTALDVATGGGHTALRFGPLVARVIASDVTLKMLEKARALSQEKGLTNVTFKAADAERLPFKAGTLELVTCRIAPHHFDECARFVQEGARVLTSGGMLLVQDHVSPEDEEAARYIDRFERLRDPSHTRVYSRSEWVAMFEHSGLRIEGVRQVVKQHQLLPWAERQGCTPEVIAHLVDMVDEAPESVRAWLEPHSWHTRQASFTNHHIIIAGRTP
jgi:ubiquinone/menaquinone biosynthesis C-methylase UbiE